MQQVAATAATASRPSQLFCLAYLTVGGQSGAAQDVGQGSYCIRKKGSESQGGTTRQAPSRLVLAFPLWLSEEQSHTKRFAVKPSHEWLRLATVISWKLEIEFSVFLSHLPKVTRFDTAAFDCKPRLSLCNQISAHAVLEQSSLCKGGCY